MAKAIYTRPEVEVLRFQHQLSLLTEGSLTKVGVDEYDQAPGEGYFDIVDGE